MEKGSNSDIIVQGRNYHVQTEDWGRENPFVVSRIYLNGAVVKSVKSHYAEIVALELAWNQESIRLAMREQHQKILDQLVSGQLGG